MHAYPSWRSTVFRHFPGATHITDFIVQLLHWIFFELTRCTVSNRASLTPCCNILYICFIVILALSCSMSVVCRPVSLMSFVIVLWAVAAAAAFAAAGWSTKACYTGWYRAFCRGTATLFSFLRNILAPLRRSFRLSRSCGKMLRRMGELHLGPFQISFDVCWLRASSGFILNAHDEKEIKGYFQVISNVTIANTVDRDMLISF